jgi:hypothetical protein
VTTSNWRAIKMFPKLLRRGGPKHARVLGSLSNPTQFARLIAYGTPEEMATCRASYTGRFLADLLHK